MERTKKPRVWLPLMFSITLILGMMIGYRMRDNMPGKSFFSIDKSKPLQEMIDLVKAKYVDDVKVEELVDTAIASILGKLDPHSVYIPAGEVQESNEDIAGNFFGIGVEYDIINDTINILHVIAGGPSEKAGIETGDKFVKISDSLVAGVKIKVEKIKALLRGKNNTAVTIDIVRGQQSKRITVQRGIIPVSSIDAAYMIEPGIGFIRLNKFSQVTYREFMEQLEKLKGKGMKSLIVDVRDNGGGVLDQAVEIADEFLDGDKLITYTAGNKFPKKEFRCKRPGLFEEGKLVVLCDEGSASASEVLMGALQDWDRATIIGRRSFGKGLVQEQYDFSDGSALRLTVARYYTPLQRSIQRPYSNGEKAYYEEIEKRFHDGEVVTMDSIKNDTSIIYKTLAGKTLYGGGGISPDIFIPMDTSKAATVYSKLMYKGILSDYAYRYYLHAKQAIKGYQSISNFSEKFSFSNEDWQQFLQFSLRDSVSLPSLTENDKQEILFRLKASVARQAWRNEGLYQVLNTKDKAVLKALEILKK